MADTPALGFDDPKTQGILALAAGLLQASAPSREPKSLGGVLGQGLTSGYAGMQAAQKAQMDRQLGQMRLAQLQQQNEMNKRAAGILSNPNGFTPEVIERVGMQAGISGHPGAATLMTIAAKMRERQDAQKQFGLLKAGEGYGGLFGTLADSPYVGTEAKALQGQIDKMDSGNPAEWMKHYERLRDTHFKGVDAANKKDNSPLSDIGRLRADLSAGRITKEDFNAAMSKRGGLGNVVPPELADVHGEDFAKKLDPATAGLVRKIANYEINPTSLSNRSGERMQILQLAAQYNPQYDQTQFASRNKVRQDFTSGQTAKNVTSINTAIGHMGTMYQMADALNNGDMQAVNTIANEIAKQTGDPRMAKYDVAMGAVANELMRVFRGVGASQQEVADWEKRFKAGQSPAQLKGVIKTGAELLESRINALNDQWDRGMGTKGGYPDLLAPKSKAFLESMRKPAPTNGGWSVRVKE